MKWILLAIAINGNGDPGFSFMGDYADKGGCDNAKREVQGATAGLKMGRSSYKLVCAPSMAGPLAPIPK